MSALAACMALGSLVLPQAMEGGPLLPEATGSPACLGARLEAAGRWTLAGSDVALNPSLSLPRARLVLGLGQGPVSARIAWNEARSAPDQGYVGVADEAFVPVLQLAEARLELRSIGLGLAAGMVDDPWVHTANEAWGARALAPTLGEDQGWMDRSDLGFLAAWSSPQRVVSLSASLSSGEGANRRERNAGQDTTLLLTVRPLAGWSGQAELLTVQAMVRDGSRGVGLARDHRQGLRLATRNELGHGGLEILRAQGVQGDPSREPWALSTWMNLAPEAAPAVAVLRYDHVLENAALDESAHGRLWAAAGARLSGGAPEAASARLLLGYTQTSAQAEAASLAGASGLEEYRAVFLQLDIDAQASFRDRSGDEIFVEAP